MRLLPLLALPLLTACASRTDVVLPLAPSIVGNSRIAEVALDIRAPARASAARLDQVAKGREGEAGRPLAELLPAAIARAAAAAGLETGRPLKLLVELDDLQAADAGEALFGGQDRLAGTVFVRDAATDAPLGQLYVDVNARSSGLMALASRSGVRERLVEAFAARIVRALAGR